jgi:hypothetical protein
MGGNVGLVFNQRDELPVTQMAFGADEYLSDLDDRTNVF